MNDIIDGVFVEEIGEVQDNSRDIMVGDTVKYCREDIWHSGKVIRIVEDARGYDIKRIQRYNLIVWILNVLVLSWLMPLNKWFKKKGYNK